MHQAERRSSRRFPLSHSASIRLLEGPPGVISGTTENVSKDGVLVRAESPLPVGAYAELILTLGSRAERSVRLSGICKVIRVEPNFKGKAFAVALSCDHPLAMMD